jgi:Predicted ring-cleavage extradiol dioxygenase
MRGKACAHSAPIGSGAMPPFEKETAGLANKNSLASNFPPDRMNEAAVELALRRVIIFALDLPKLAAFYGDVLGLALVHSEKGWREFDAGSCRLALHESRTKAAGRPPKIVFTAGDVAAVRQALLQRGAPKMGLVKSTAHFDMCDGEDPEGNPFQISSRA